MKNDTKNISLAFSFNQNYLTPFYVLLTSIFINNTQESIDFHVILTGTTQQQNNDIINFVESHNSKIFFYTIEIDYVKSFAPHSERYGLATFYRLLLPQLLPVQLEKIIYLDVDIIVIGSLRELYEVQLNCSPLAAVSEPVDETRPDLGLHAVGEYFNAGVLLINLPAWRTQKVTEQAIEFLKNYPEIAIFLDQDALNAVLVKNWVALDDKFNYTWRAIPFVPQSELESIVAEKNIVHYNSSLKPWNRLSGNRLNYLYHQYMVKSPVANLPHYLPERWNYDAVNTFVKMSVVNFYFKKPLLMRMWKMLKKGSK